MADAMKCSKCGARSGDDWKQCGGSCPMPGSPHCAASPPAREEAPDEGAGEATQVRVDWDEYADDIADAISDSIDMDWTSRDGARAVVSWLNENAPYRPQGDRK